MKWLGHSDPALWNFVQSTPASARVEDVAATLWGDSKKSTMAFAVTKYGDLFRVAPAHARMVIKTRYPHEPVGSSDTDANAATQLVTVAQSRIRSGDAAARELEDTLSPREATKPETVTRDQLMAVEEAIASQLGSMHDQVSRFGLAGHLVPAMQSNLDRLAKTRTADDATRVQLAPVAQFQRTQLLSIAPLMAPLVQAYPTLLLPELVLTKDKRQRRDAIKTKLTKLVQAAGVSHLRNESTGLLNEVMREDADETLDTIDAAHADIHDATRQAVTSGAGADKYTGVAEGQLTSVRRRAQLGLSQSPYDRQKALVSAGEAALRNRMRSSDAALENLRQTAVEVYGDEHAFRRHFPGARSVPEIILAVRDHLNDVNAAWQHGYDDEYARHGVQDDPNAPSDWADWNARGKGLQEAQKAFGKIAGDKDLNKWFREIQKEIKDQAFRNAVTTVVIVLLLTIATSGVASAIGEAVATTLVAETAAELAVEAGAITARGMLRGVIASAVSAPINSLVQMALSDGEGSLGWITLENTLMELFTRGMMSRYRAAQNALKLEAHELSQLPHLTAIERQALTSFSYTGMELTGELVAGMASQWAAHRLVQTFRANGQQASEPFAATLLQQGAAIAIGRFFGARIHEWTKHRALVAKTKAGSLPEAKALFKAREEFYVQAKQLGQSLSPDPAAGEVLAREDAALLREERALHQSERAPENAPKTPLGKAKGANDERTVADEGAAAASVSVDVKGKGDLVASAPADQQLTAAVIALDPVEGRRILSELGPDALEYLYANPPPQSIMELREGVAKHRAQVKERVAGFYEDISEDAPERWTIDSQLYQERDGTKVVKSTVVGPNKAVGYFERAYNPKTEEIELRMAFLRLGGEDAKLPSMVPKQKAAIEMVSGKGTPTVQWITLHQMKRLGVPSGNGTGGVRKVHMSDIQNIETIVHLHYLRTKTGGDVSDLVHHTASVQYGNTTVRQLGYETSDMPVVTGGRDERIGELMTFQETRRDGTPNQSRVDENNRLLARYGYTRDTVMRMAFDIDFLVRRSK